MVSNKFIGYQCSVCSRKYGTDEVTYTCPDDGGNLDVVLDYDSIKERQEIIISTDLSLWRYLPLLPVTDPGGYQTPLRVCGLTPTFAPVTLAKNLGMKFLWVKDEGRNPTASFKDRASAILVARAREIEAEVIVTASTGNAGAALAGMAAAVGRKTVIFAPKDAPPAKIAQLLVYGAQVFLVDGNYDSAFELSIEASREFGWYCRNTGYNPFTAEGKKTASFEIYEYLLKDPEKTNHFSPYGVDEVSRVLKEKPLSVFVSVGDGNIISGIHKGFKDLKTLNLISGVPRIFGIQSEGSAAITNAYNLGTEIIEPVAANTCADSISVDMPRDGLRALRAATQTGGAFISVADHEILQAIAELGRVGIFAEPAGSASYAGLKIALQKGYITEDDPVLILNTGSGLKDIKAAVKATGNAPIIEPTIDAVRKLIK